MTAQIADADREAVAAVIGARWLTDGMDSEVDTDALVEAIAQLLADQREQLTPRGLRPVPMNFDQLLEVLAGISNVVRARDSFGGSIEFDAMDGPPCTTCKGRGAFPDGEPCADCLAYGEEHLPEDKQFWVRGAYRYGNSEGQGGVRIIGEIQ